MGGKLRTGAAARLRASAKRTGLDLRVVQRLSLGVMQLLEHVGRRALGRHQSRPECLRKGNACLPDRRNVRQRRRALWTRNAQRTHLVALDSAAIIHSISETRKANARLL